ncbi:MAG: carboxylating nicotinate-nucleotide diphosphorylase [Polyangiaceae bacterium]|nr:carboxylating nicotinate-nucleotide diphosphorylase [Polyangiaceae bacterium]
MRASFDLLPLVIDRAVAVAVEEDLASGDMTTEACVDSDARAVAHAVARHPLVVCGGTVFARTFTRVDDSLEVECHAEEGARAQAGARLWTVRGLARSILMAERVALNFVQRMSGIATMTRAFVDAVPPGTKARIADTRKTTPGLRALERYAVRVGGGHNHRDNPGAAVLIKDNHIAASGGVRRSIHRARGAAPHTTKIACEVDSLEQLDEALEAGADVVLLDNMDLNAVAAAVARAEGRVVLEVSGGVTLDRVSELARTGVDVISVGALTPSVATADIALDFEP